MPLSEASNEHLAETGTVPNFQESPEITEPEVPGKTEETPQDARSDRETPFSRLFKLDPDASSDQIKALVTEHVTQVIEAHPIAATYNVLILHKPGSIIRSDADRIYRAISTANPNRPTLLVVSSPGGDIAAAYFIAKLCRESTLMSFEVVVPRQAKSAATLIACGADRIHMGSLSELGPIDPQFGGIPALSLKHSVEHIALLTAAHPESADMFASYLAHSLRIEALGFYERVAESASHYAIRLLNSRLGNLPSNNEAIANKLVYDYKDHGFVIDSREATEIFGPEVVALNTPEYELGNAVYGAVDFIAWIVDHTFERDTTFAGSPADGCWVLNRAT